MPRSKRGKGMKKPQKRAVALDLKQKGISSLKSDVSPDLSPLKGFAENELSLQDKDLVFDRLVNPDFKLESMNKPIRTYVRERIPSEEIPVVESSESCRSRENIIKWLNDTRNVFDKFTQESPIEHLDVNTPAFTLETVSVSQRHVRKRKQNRQQCPYRLRPRSLEINYNKKNEARGKNKRCSLPAAASSNVENYSIESVSTDNDEEPFILAETRAKLFMDLLEDECLNNIDQELHQDRKSDWDRIKDLNKTLNQNQPKLKQLDITVYSNENKKDILPRKSYDLNVLESYIQEKMEKELNITVDKKTDPLNELGNYFLKSLQKLQNERLLQFQPLITEISALFKSDMQESSTQTTPHCHFDNKMTQTSLKMHSVEIESDLPICAIISKDIMDKEVQTDDPLLSENNLKCSRSSSVSNLLLESEMDRLFSVIENQSNINRIRDDKTIFEADQKDSSITKNTALDDSLDLCMDTEDFIKAQIFPNPVDTSNKGVKRPRNESPLREKSILAKRPCDKFIEADLSIAFVSEQVGDVDVESYISSTDDDIFSDSVRAENISKMSTQEEVEKYDDLIHNANKVVNITLSSNDSVLGAGESNCDYKVASETPKGRNVRTRNSTNCGRPLFSESLFDDGETTVLENRTLVNEKDDKVKTKIDIVPKVKILQDIVLQNSTLPDLVDHVSVEDSSDSSSSDKDIVDPTPVSNTSYTSRKKNKLNISLPPPVEFQDFDDLNINTESSPSRRPLAVVNKICSTPLTGRPDSELLSLSPVEDKRNLGPIEIVQKTKFYPLTINSTSSQKSSLRPASKQKSILNYVKSSSQESKFSNKPFITCSLLPRNQVVAIGSLANKNLINFSSSFSSKVTHLIVLVNKSNNRLIEYTIKFVRAVAAGIWVLNFQWIEECIAANRLIPEGPYEVYDISGALGPKTSRLTRHINPLLKGFRIFATNDFVSTSKKEVVEIIEMIGGEVVSTLNDLAQKSIKCSLILTESRSSKDYKVFDEWLNTYRVATVDLEWLGHSLGQYKLQNLRPYTLCSEDSLDHLGYPMELTLSVSYSSGQTYRSSLSVIK